MAKAPKPAPATASDTDADRLQASVSELAQNVCVLTDIVDQLREDLSWLTRNGMPHQPVTVVVHRMPLVAEVPGNGSMELSFHQWPNRDPTADMSDDGIRAAVIDDIVQRLAEPLGEIAQEQLNVLVSLIDHAHREVLQAIRTPRAEQPKGPSPMKAPRRKTKPQPAIPPVRATTADPPPPLSTPLPSEPASPKPPPGRLF
jgi:hypothetical protein